MLVGKLDMPDGAFLNAPCPDVLFCPQVVPQLLGVLLGVLDRLAALQMALCPPVISGRFTGR
jgi:hypothetical protein